MTNKDIIRTVAECSNPYNHIIAATCKIKDEDFLKKIDEVLQYYDCDAYTDHAREGFRIFARGLKNIVELNSNDDEK